MQSLIAAAFIATLATSAAQAMPVAPVHADGLTTQVAQGCGPGMARNRAGHCRPAFVVRACPPGRHKNRFGVCVRN
jgi:hypothetical protein